MITHFKLACLCLLTYLISNLKFTVPFHTKHIQSSTSLINLISSSPNYQHINLRIHQGLKAIPDTSNYKRPHKYVTFTGIGSSAPQTLLTNNDLEKIVETSDEWITTRTGISRRHILGPEENLSKIAIEASKNALKMAKLNSDDIDLIIFSSSSPDDMFGDAAYIGSQLGANRASCFDLTAACSGFLFGLITASQYIENGSYKNVLVIGADALSRWVDWKDRNTCILFGDGAGAIICQASNEAQANGMLSWSMHSDGSKKRHLTLKSLNKTTKLNDNLDLTVNIGNYSPIQMNGRDVFLFATREVPAVISQALDKANLSVNDLDWLLLHQANQRILNSVAEKLGVPKNKILSNLDEYGNTSAGSIPLCLDAAVASGKVKNGDLIAVAGFGAGLSWGSSIIRWGGPTV